MKSKAYWLALGLAVLLTGCTPKPEPASETDDTKGLRHSLRAADCTGRLARDAAQAVSGAADCRNGAKVVFSGRSNAPLAPDLSCRYSLFYTGGGHGDGYIECSDGSAGDFVFKETDSTHGIATARLKDGREITLTYTQTVR